MTVDEVIEHFDGISPTAKALNISYQAVQQWVDKKDVPEGRQYQIQHLSKGKLKVSEH